MIKGLDPAAPTLFINELLPGHKILYERWVVTYPHTAVVRAHNPKRAPVDHCSVVFKSKQRLVMFKTTVDKEKFLTWLRS